MDEGVSTSSTLNLTKTDKISTFEVAGTVLELP